MQTKSAVRYLHLLRGICKVRKSSARVTSTPLSRRASSACLLSSETSSSSPSFCRELGLYLWLKWYSTSLRAQQARATAAAISGVLCPWSTAFSRCSFPRVASCTRMSAPLHNISGPSPRTELQSPKMQTFLPGMASSSTSLGQTTCPLSRVTGSPAFSRP